MSTINVIHSRNCGAFFQKPHKGKNKGLFMGGRDRKHNLKTKQSSWPIRSVAARHHDIPLQQNTATLPLQNADRVDTILSRHSTSSTTTAIGHGSHVLRTTSHFSGGTSDSSHLMPQTSRWLKSKAMNQVLREHFRLEAFKANRNLWNAEGSHDHPE